MVGPTGDASTSRGDGTRLPSTSAAPRPRARRGTMLVGGILALSLATCAVLIHFGAPTVVSDKVMPHLDEWGRWRLIAMFGILIPVHLLEILMFAIGYWGLHSFTTLGHLEGALDPGLRSHLYFSASAYTSLGFGDIVPHGELRLITSLETLCGLILIGWSASFTYLEMGRYWDARP